MTGAGFGAAFSGTLRVLMPLAKPGTRAGLFAAVYLVGYLAYGFPTVAIGFLIDVTGLASGAILYAIAEWWRRSPRSSAPLPRAPSGVRMLRRQFDNRIYLYVM